MTNEHPGQDRFRYHGSLELRPAGVGRLARRNDSRSTHGTCCKAGTRTGREEGYEFVESVLEQLGSVETAPSNPTDVICVVPLRGNPRSDAPEIVENLDRGEAHVLYCAGPEYTIATDDLDARTLARERGIPVTGSIGLLVDGVESNRLDVETADEWLETWQRYGYHSPVDSVVELLDSGAR